MSFFVLMEGFASILRCVVVCCQDVEVYVWGVPGTSKGRDSRVCPGRVLWNGKASLRFERTLDGTPGLPRFQAQAAVC